MAVETFKTELMQANRDFFNRPAKEIIKEFLGSTLVIGSKRFLLAQARSYNIDSPGRNWKGARTEELKSMNPGEVIAYDFRGSLLSYLIVAGGDNIMLRSFENVQSGEILSRCREVTEALGFTEHGQKGRLTLMDPEGEEFMFELLSNKPIDPEEANRYLQSLLE